MIYSRYQWTEKPWNPTTGCTKVSVGCTNCCVEQQIKLQQGRKLKQYENGFKVACHNYQLYKPLRWKKPKYIAVSTMGDLFHPEVPTDFIKSVFSIMNQSSWHKFQVLTKRPKRLYRLRNELEFTKNVWLGVSIESPNYLHRMDSLKKVDASTKFVAFEPLLEPMPKLDLSGIDWILVGGETGPKARPIKERWVKDIKQQCKTQDVPFFFKQWGGINKKKAKRIIEGRVYGQMPNFKNCYAIFT